VLAAYLVVLVAIGVAATRRTRTSEQYHLGGRGIGAWVTSLSYVAAYFSSVVIIGGGAFAYRYGMATLWIGAANVLIGATLVWIVLGRRVRQFTERLSTMTVPGFLAERFRAPEARVLGAIVIGLFLIVYNVSILKGMGNAFEVLLGMPYVVGVLVSGVVILLYVALGGYLAVVWTGFFQAWVMGAGLILLTVAAVRAVGGISAANLALAQTHRGLVETPGAWGWAGLVSYALITSFGVWGMPQMVVRFYSIKSVKVLRIGTVLATVGCSLAVLPYLNGAIARVLVPNLANADQAIPALTRAVLSPWASAVFLAGVMAAGMSTFAAVLIITSSAIVKDLVQDGLGRKLEERASLRWSRFASVVVGLVSLAIALRPPALVLVLMGFSWAVIASTCLWPIVFGVYWKRTTRWGVLASMVGGFIASLVWMAMGSPFGLHGFVAGISVSLVLIVVVSLFTTRLPDDVLARAWGGTAGRAKG